jgi:hypothetical protein
VANAGDDWKVGQMAGPMTNHTPDAASTKPINPIPLRTPPPARRIGLSVKIIKPAATATVPGSKCRSQLLVVHSHVVAEVGR